MGRRLSAADLEGSQVVDAPPTPAGKTRLSAADLEGSQVVDGGGAAGAFVRGGVQGVTMGFAEEIAAAVKYGLTGADYRAERDKMRAENKAAKDAHPLAYGAGEVTGGVASAFVPGLGVAKGAGLAVKGARAAVGGMTAGLGASEADLTRGQFLDATKDAAIGAGVGMVTTGAAHGLGKLASGAGKALRGGAERRIENRTVADVLDRVPASIQDRSLAQLGGREGLQAAVKVEGLAKVLKKPEKFLDAVEKAKETVGAEIGGTIKATAPVPLPKLIDALEGVRAKFVAEADPRADIVQGEIERIAKSWGGELGTETVSAQNVHKLAQRFGRAGFGGNYSNPGEARLLGREMNSAVRGALQEHIEATGGDVGKLRALNQRYSRLSALEDIAEAKTKREARNSPSLGQRFGELAQNFGGAAGVVGAVATGNFAPLALPAAIKAAPHVPRVADQVLARTVKFLQKGGSKTEALQRALQAGVPRATAEQVVEAYGTTD